MVKEVKREKAKGRPVPIKRRNDSFSIFSDAYKPHHPYILAIAVILLAMVVWRSKLNGIKNLINAKELVLKEALAGSEPYLIHCYSGKGDISPPIFTELNQIKGSKLGFAVVNCSQVLPSGKTMWEKFKLKRLWKPVIFGVAPWTRPKQAMPKHLSDVKALSVFVDTALAPRAVPISSDKELANVCGFSRNLTTDPYSITPTCIALMKGGKHTKAQIDLEERLIRQNPRVKFVVVDASKKRFSFEGADLLPIDHFALKVHAMRNGTHFLSMVNPVTWDYLSTFMTQAVGSPLDAYAKDAGGQIRLLKGVPSVFKERRSTPPSSGSSSSSARDRGRDKSGKKSETSAKSSAPASSDPAPPAMTEAERIQKERERRLEMERQAREYMVQEEAEEADTSRENDEPGYNGDDDVDSDSEDVIEL